MHFIKCLAFDLETQSAEFWGRYQAEMQRYRKKMKKKNEKEENKEGEQSPGSDLSFITSGIDLLLPLFGVLTTLFRLLDGGVGP